jgi:hypothetical protein
VETGRVLLKGGENAKIKSRRHDQAGDHQHLLPDITVRQRRGRLRRSGLVNPLDVLVTSPILSEANKIIKGVQHSRRTDTTVNILKTFLDVPLNSELNSIQKISDVTLWLADYAQYHELDADAFFGRNAYQNLTNLEEAGYLRRPTKGMEYDTPALQTTAKGVAYLMWHDELDDDALLRMLITGTTKDIGYVPADISNTYKTPWQIHNDDYFSAILVNTPTQIFKYTQHLIGAESTKFVRKLAAGVFTKNAREVWKTLGPVQVPFLKHFVHRSTSSRPKWPTPIFPTRSCPTSTTRRN